MKSSKPRYRIYGGVRNYLNTIADIALGRWHRGNEVELLEETMRREFKVEAAIAAPMARVGIYLVVKNLIPAGKKVLLSPYTIADVINMVIAAGGVPVFVDVDAKSGNMSPEKLREKIDGDSALVLVTHLHGVAAEIEEIAAICADRGLPLVEDCAQALGAEVHGQKLGTFGLAGIFSFGTYKNINSWFGGLIVCRDQGLARAIREEMRQWPEFSLRYVQRKMIYASLIDMLGWQPLFAAIVHRIFRYGFIRDIARINRAVAIELDTSRHDNLPRHYQSRMSPGQARLILKQLPHVQAHARKRIAYASRYAEGIKATPSRQPPSPQGSRHVYTYYPLQAGSRQNLLKWLMFFHRDIAAQHLKNCAHLESFKEFYSPCPVADEVANSVILLPTYPSYGMNQVERNIQVINWYFAAGAPEFILEEASQVLKRQPWLETLPSQ